MYRALAVEVFCAFLFLAASQAQGQGLEEAKRLQAKGDLQGAEALLKGLVEANPTDAEALVEWSRVLAELGQEEEALRACERATQLRPEDDEVRLWLAELYLRQNQPDSALEHYLLVLKRRPHSIALRKRVAEVLTWLDRNEEAVGHLEAYVAAVPTDVESLKALYRLYLWTDREEKAFEVLERVLELDPTDKTLKLEYARRCEDFGWLEKAIKAYEDLAKVDPSEPEAPCALGRLYEWTASPKKALKNYERCLALRPFDVEARERALSLSLDLGEARKAREHASVLAASGVAHEELTRRALLLEAGHKTSLGVDFSWFNDRLGFDHISLGPSGGFALGEAISVGARYRFHWLKGHPDLAGTQPEVEFRGHEIGAFSEIMLKEPWLLELAAWVTHYEGTWTSVGARVEQKADFDRVSLSIFAERADHLATAGAVQDKVVFNTGGTSVFWSVWRGLFLDTLFEVSYVNPDGNVRWYGWGALGYTILEMPRLAASYTYTLEHFRDNDTNGHVRKYFNPRAYQTHGPALTFRHPVTTWFFYGVDLRLWHAVRDDALLLTYGFPLGFRVARRHFIDLSYTRTDTLIGSTTTLYSENVLTFSYVFEF